MDGWTDEKMKRKIIAQDLPMKISPMVLKMVLSVEMPSIFIYIHLFQYYKNLYEVFHLGSHINEYC